MLGKIETKDYFTNSFSLYKYLLFIMIIVTTRSDVYVLTLLYSRCTGYLMSLSHSRKYGRRALDCKNRYKSGGGSMFLETDLLLYIFGMLLTSGDGEAFFSDDDADDDDDDKEEIGNRTKRIYRLT